MNISQNMKFMVLVSEIRLIIHSNDTPINREAEVKIFSSLFFQISYDLTTDPAIYC